MVTRGSNTHDDSYESVDSYRTKLSDSEWMDLRGVVRSHAGIKLSEAKRVFLESRLHKRLRATKTRSFREYYNLVARAGVGSEEHQQLINAVTTNKTEFFRERAHFDVLTRWLRSPYPEVLRRRREGLRIWCAATSTGEEPYTLAAVLREVLDDFEWSRLSIFASDIDTSVLAMARRAVYDESALATVDRSWRMRMFVRGHGSYRDQYRIRRELRERIRFFQLNLMQDIWPQQGLFDAIFCRNVLIYFERPTQEQVVRRLLQRLAPHGLLFLGHAECLNGFSISTQAVAHSVYAHPGAYAPAKVKISRLENARTNPASSSQWRTSKPQLGATAAASSHPEGTEWATQRVERGFLLLLYAADWGVTHYEPVATDGGELREAIRRAAAELLEARVRQSSAAEGIQCKIIVGPQDPRSAPVDLARLERELSADGVQLVASRQLESATEVRVQAKAGRIQILHASSGDAG